MREGPLGLLFVPDPFGQARMAVVLDDRDSWVGMAGFRESWIAWLHLHTLLSFADTARDITVSSVQAEEAPESVVVDAAMAPVGTVEPDLGAGGAGTSAGAPAASDPRTSDAAEPGLRTDFAAAPAGDAPVDVGWEHLVEDDDLLDEERAFLRALLAAGVTHPPVVGEETDSGLPLELSWPQFKVAVLLDPEDGNVQEAEAAGWTVVSAVADTVRGVLEAAEVQAAAGRGIEGDEG